MKIQPNTVKEAEDFLNDLPKFTSKHPPDHTKELMRRIGDPYSGFKVIHVAGSNGKGSVCSFLFHILREAGKSAGLYTSPHLIDIRERFVINGSMCSEADFLEAFAQVEEPAEAMEAEGEGFPTYFEFLTAMGMLIFRKHQVEYLVLETGLGGRLDCTNVVPRPELCVITSISLEHTQYLGNTIEEVAWNKAGIIKPGVPVVYDGSDPAAAAVIREEAERLGSKSYEILKNRYQIRETGPDGIDFSFSTAYDRKSEWNIPFFGQYQAANASLAICAASLLLADLPAAEADDVISRGLARTEWPGRMQQVRPEIYLDGAHNPDGIHQFLETVRVLCAKDEERPVLLFSMVSDKDYTHCASMLAGEVSWDAIIVTGMHSSRGLQAEELREAFAEAGAAVEAVPDLKTAWESVCERKRPGQKVFAAGSLYFVGELLALLQEETD